MVVPDSPSGFSSPAQKEKTVSWEMSGRVKKIVCGKNGEPITTTQKLLMMLLADYHNEEEGTAWPSMTTLSKQCLSDERTIQRAVRHLESCGLLFVERGTGAVRSTYCLLPEGRHCAAPVDMGVTSVVDIGATPEVEIGDVSIKSLKEEEPTEPKEDVGEVFKLLKRYYRQKIGKSIGTPGSYGEAFAAAVQRSSGDVVLAAGKLWVDELDKTFMRTVRWPFAMFMKHIEQRLEEYEDQKIAASQSDENGEEPDPRRSMLRTDQGRKILEKYS